MHDPDTLAFTIRWPWAYFPLLKRSATRPDPVFYQPWEVLFYGGSYNKSNHLWYCLPYKNRFEIMSIWHRDPCKDGSDDSCGWFKRSRHGHRIIWEKIVKQFELDWDCVFQGETGTYNNGFFSPDGKVMFTVPGTALNLFFMAAIVVFHGSRKKAVKFMNKNLFEILFFAENPVDSLHSSIVQKYGPAGSRKERMEQMAHVIYGWILRAIRPWYKHPRWHFWHWRIKIHMFHRLRYRLRRRQGGMR